MEIALIFMCLAIVLLGLCIVELTIKINRAIGTLVCIEEAINCLGQQVDNLDVDAHDYTDYRECNQVGLLCPYEDDGYCPFDSCRWED